MTALRLALLLLVPACDVLGLGGSGGPGGDDDDDDSGLTTEPPPGSDLLECREPFETPAPGAAGLGECVTGTLACGETVRGTIEGGSTAFSNQYEAPFEWCSGHSTGDELDGPERVYRVDVPAEYDYASVRLVSCERTQILWYQTDQVCPTERVNCSYDGVHGGVDQQEDIVLSGSGVIWFVVEGLDGATGNFELSVECGSRQR